jgi:hypothetical protein
MFLIDYLYCTVWNKDIDIGDLVFVTVKLTFSRFSELKLFSGHQYIFRSYILYVLFGRHCRGLQPIYKYMYTKEEGRALK